MAGSRLSEPSGVEGDGEREHAVVEEDDMEVEREKDYLDACGNASLLAFKRLLQLSTGLGRELYNQMKQI